MAAECPRCARPLKEDGTCPSCDERKSGKLGDATLGRIAGLAGGWSLAAAQSTPENVPVLEAEEAGATEEADPDAGTEIDVASDDGDGDDQDDEDDVFEAETVAAAEKDGDATREMGAAEEAAHVRRSRALSDTLSLLEDDLSTAQKPAPEPPPAPPPPAALPRAPLAPPAPKRSVALPSPPAAAASRPPPGRRTAPPPIPKDAPPARAGTVTLPPELKPREEDTTFDARSPVAEPTPTPDVERVVVKKRGVLGDVTYVGSVFLSAVTGRREISSMKERLGFERAARERRLSELAKAAAADTRLDDAIFTEARARLATIDEDLAVHDQALTDAEAEAVRADQALAAKVKEITQTNVDLEGQIAKLEKEELAPLEARQAAKKKAFEQLKTAVTESARRISALEKKLARATVSEPELRQDVEADLAAARAEKEALARDEPAAAEAVTELQPQIDAARQRREELVAEIKKNKELSTAESERLGFQAKAARGRKGDSERARKTVAARREEELVRLGEAIDRDRPRALLLKLRPADEHAAAIAILERRILELEDAAKVVDKEAVRRGLLWLAAAGVGLIAVVWLIVAAI